MEEHFKIIAHRGATTETIKENTLEAFQRAIDLKADMIETDVRRMQDGSLVCAHNRDWRGKQLKNMTYKEWSGMTKAAEGWKPALLKDVLNLCHKGIPLNLEIKEINIHEEVIQAIPSSFPNEKLLLSSFEDQVIKEIKNKNSRLRTALIVGKSLLKKTRKKMSFSQDYYPEERLRKTGADAICPYHRLVNESYVSRLQNRGYSVNVWTVNRKEQIWEMSKLGVNGIFTDNVPLAQALLNND